MPVETTHPAYALALPLWAKCRDACAGQEAVHAAGYAHLPKLTGQEDGDYLAYMGRALYYNATGRTLEALTGMVFRRPPTDDIPDAFDYLKLDIDGAGTALASFAHQAVDELIQVGRVGLLVDYPRVSPARTLAEERTAGARPFVAMYRAEDILNWRFETVAGRRRLALLVLRETVQVPVDDFETKGVTQWRVLRLDDGRYSMQLWRKDGAGVAVVEETVEPTIAGAQLDFIPFVLCGPHGIAELPDKPPILDLANVNLSHYRGTADYEHGLHFTGLPTAVVTGYRNTDTTFSIGSTTAWVFGEADTKAYFLEFKGEGLTQLRESLERKEAMMAALGARMLAPEKRQSEAADTVAMRHGGENGVLAALANSASAMLSQALTWCVQWAGGTEQVSVVLNTDYLPAGLSPQQLAALVAALQAGAISRETFYHNLQRGEIAQPGIDFEAEQARIKAAPTPVEPVTQQV